MQPLQKLYLEYTIMCNLIQETTKNGKARLQSKLKTLMQR